VWGAIGATGGHQCGKFAKNLRLHYTHFRSSAISPPPYPLTCLGYPHLSPLVSPPRPHGIHTPHPLPFVAPPPPPRYKLTTHYCLLSSRAASLLLHVVRSWYSRVRACTRSRNGERCDATPWYPPCSHALTHPHSSMITLSPYPLSPLVSPYPHTVHFTHTPRRWELFYPNK
jgi:hypothetical protein